jgi:hypothetical protein
MEEQSFTVTGRDAERLQQLVDRYLQMKKKDGDNDSTDSNSTGTDSTG